MDYKEKYEAALAVAQETYNTQPMYREWLKSMFPELKKSEDERIRESLLEYLHTLPNHYSHSGVCVPEWIAWLEKQSEHANFRNKIQIGDNVTRNEDGVLVNLSQLQRVAKPADKIEPKFHEGDWTVSNLDGKARQISEVHFDEYNSYYVVNGQSVNLEEYDRLHHLWTIQDAKNGDVIVTHSGIVFIFKNIMEGGTISFHAALSTPNFASNTKIHIPEDNEQLGDQEVFPATKEQREQLEKAMANAGYTFDFDKKELKKIDQKSDIQINPSEYINDMGGNGCYLKNTAQASVWSEEDENFMYDTLSNLTELKDRYGAGYGNVGKCIDWLKSLRPQSAWKPSDE